MKHLFLGIMLFLSLFSGLNAQEVKNVDAATFKDMIAKGNMILLDVRTPGEYARGHIQGSTTINIADPDFTSKVGLLQKDKTVLVYCLSGSRSNSAANYMAKNGFKKIITLQHGLMDWNQNGFALEQSSQPVASTSTVYTEQSFNQLLKDNKLVLVDFNAVWCAPCKAMMPVIDKLSVDFKGKAKVEKVDVEVNKVITSAFQVQTIPGFVIFKDGKKVWSHNGPISYEELSLTIKKFI